MNLKMSLSQNEVMVGDCCYGCCFSWKQLEISSTRFLLLNIDQWKLICNDIESWTHVTHMWMEVIFGWIRVVMTSPRHVSGHSDEKSAVILTNCLFSFLQLQICKILAGLSEKVNQVRNKTWCCVVIVNKSEIFSVMKPDTKHWSSLFSYNSASWSVL